jgi:hypothetical protein
MSTDQLVGSLTQGKHDNEKQLKGPEEVQNSSEGGLELIRPKLADPNVRAVEVLPLITLEIHSVVTRMLSLGFTAEEGQVLRWLVQQVKVLRVLGKQVMGTYSMRRQEGVPNLDGLSYGHLIRDMLRWFQEAMEKAGVDESQRKSIMKNFQDVVRASKVRQPV